MLTLTGTSEYTCWLFLGGNLGGVDVSTGSCLRDAIGDPRLGTTVGGDCLRWVGSSGGLLLDAINPTSGVCDLLILNIVQYITAFMHVFMYAQYKYKTETSVYK